MQLCVCVGDSGNDARFISFTDLLGYLNELNVGRVDRWVESGVLPGFMTPNYHGYDFVSCYWGDAEANLDRA